MDDSERFRIEVEDLRNTIQRLRAEQARVEAGLQAAETRLSQITIREQDRQQQRDLLRDGGEHTQRLRYYTRGWRPRINDQVRILNPRQGQRNFGIIQGFCTDGKVKVSTTEGVITRAPKNIACVRRYRP